MSSTDSKAVFAPPRSWPRLVPSPIATDVRIGVVPVASLSDLPVDLIVSPAADPIDVPAAGVSSACRMERVDLTTAVPFRWSQWAAAISSADPSVSASEDDQVTAFRVAVAVSATATGFLSPVASATVAAATTAVLAPQPAAGRRLPALLLIVAVVPPGVSALLGSTSSGTRDSSASGSSALKIALTNDPSRGTPRLASVSTCVAARSTVVSPFGRTSQLPVQDAAAAAAAAASSSSSGGTSTGPMASTDSPAPSLAPPHAPPTLRSGLGDGVHTSSMEEKLLKLKATESAMSRCSLPSSAAPTASGTATSKLTGGGSAHGHAPVARVASRALRAIVQAAARRVLCFVPAGSAAVFRGGNHGNHRGRGITPVSVAVPSPVSSFDRGAAEARMHGAGGNVPLGTLMPSAAIPPVQGLTGAGGTAPVSEADRGMGMTRPDAPAADAADGSPDSAAFDEPIGDDVNAAVAVVAGTAHILGACVAAPSVVLFPPSMTAVPVDVPAVPRWCRQQRRRKFHGVPCMCHLAASRPPRHVVAKESHDGTEDPVPDATKRGREALDHSVDEADDAEKMKGNASGIYPGHPSAAAGRLIGCVCVGFSDDQCGCGTPGGAIIAAPESLAVARRDISNAPGNSGSGPLRHARHSVPETSVKGDMGYDPKLADPPTPPTPSTPSTPPFPSSSAAPVPPVLVFKGLADAGSQDLAEDIVMAGVPRQRAGRDLRPHFTTVNFPPPDAADLSAVAPGPVAPRWAPVRLVVVPTGTDPAARFSAQLMACGLANELSAALEVAHRRIRAYDEAVATASGSSAPSGPGRAKGLLGGFSRPSRARKTTGTDEQPTSVPRPPLPAGVMNALRNTPPNPLLVTVDPAAMGGLPGVISGRPVSTSQPALPPGVRIVALGGMRHCRRCGLPPAAARGLLLSAGLALDSAPTMPLSGFDARPFPLGPAGCLDRRLRFPPRPSMNVCKACGGRQKHDAEKPETDPSAPNVPSQVPVSSDAESTDDDYLEPSDVDAEVGSTSDVAEGVAHVPSSVGEHHGRDDKQPSSRECPNASMPVSSPGAVLTAVSETMASPASMPAVTVFVGGPSVAEVDVGSTPLPSGSTANGATAAGASGAGNGTRGRGTRQALLVAAMHEMSLGLESRWSGAVQIIVAPPVTSSTGADVLRRVVSVFSGTSVVVVPRPRVTALLYDSAPVSCGDAPDRKDSPILGSLGLVSHSGGVAGADSATAAAASLALAAVAPSDAAAAVRYTLVQQSVGSRMLDTGANGGGESLPPEIKDLPLARPAQRFAEGSVRAAPALHEPGADRQPPNPFTSNWEGDVSVLDWLVSFGSGIDGDLDGAPPGAARTSTPEAKSSAVLRRLPVCIASVSSADDAAAGVLTADAAARAQCRGATVAGRPLPCGAACEHTAPGIIVHAPRPSWHVGMAAAAAHQTLSMSAVAHNDAATADIESSDQSSMPHDGPGKAATQPYPGSHADVDMQSPPSVTNALFPAAGRFVGAAGAAWWPAVQRALAGRYGAVQDALLRAVSVRVNEPSPTVVLFSSPSAASASAVAAGGGALVVEARGLKALIPSPAVGAVLRAEQAGAGPFAPINCIVVATEVDKEDDESADVADDKTADARIVFPAALTPYVEQAAAALVSAAAYWRTPAMAAGPRRLVRPVRTGAASASGESSGGTTDHPGEPAAQPDAHPSGPAGETSAKEMRTDSAEADDSPSAKRRRVDETHETAVAAAATEKTDCGRQADDGRPRHPSHPATPSAMVAKLFAAVGVAMASSSRSAGDPVPPAITEDVVFMRRALAADDDDASRIHTCPVAVGALRPSSLAALQLSVAPIAPTSSHELSALRGIGAASSAGGVGSSHTHQSLALGSLGGSSGGSSSLPSFPTHPIGHQSASSGVAGACANRIPATGGAAAGAPIEATHSAGTSGSEDAALRALYEATLARAKEGGGRCSMGDYY
eukprot:TRINITY_DN4099_c0_g1_i1.p1 TRINITY_DN4099_c0_g1~~TRINITY_DN4099_c0_g1_i1.p1  ORF type:complete len:1953 (-),score=119.45 TRINITY_DN4099_c0_g1_i1:599-6457(-)